MAVRFVTVAEVRTASGVDSDLVSDADVTDIIEDVEYGVERELNTFFTPRVIIESLTGKPYSDVIRVRRVPLLAVRSVISDDDTLTVSSLKFYKESGIIQLTSDSSIGSFSTETQRVRVKYVCGFREWRGSTETTLSSASSAGTTVALSVGASTGFTTGDWLWVEGTDGNAEAAKITNTGTGSITVDQLSYAHESGSLVRLLEIPVPVLRLIKVVAALALVARVVGESFDERTGYTLGDLQVQKGEPYTQWRETALLLTKERDRLMDNISIRPAII